MADTIVLSGGGIKGIGQLGALHYCREKGYLDMSRVNTLAGTSIGSIICLLLVCGFEPIEIFSEVYQKDSFFKMGDVKNFWDLVKDFGLMAITPLIAEIERMILKKYAKIPTLLELYELTGKTLIVAVSNVTKTKAEYFSHITRPHLLCIDAVKFSSNLPVIFQRLHYNDCYYVDGGLLDNFPIKQVDRGTNRILGIVTIGADNSSDDQGVFNYLYRLIIMPINMITELRQEKAGANSAIITMNFDNIPVLDFSMPPAKKMQMFVDGYKEAEKMDTLLKEKLVRPPMDIVDDNLAEVANAWGLEFEECVPVEPREKKE